MVRLHPLAGLPAPWTQLRHEMSRLFDDFLGQRVAGSTDTAVVGTFPAVNLWEREHDFVVEAELPGVQEADLDISVVGNELTIKGSRGDQSAEGTTFHRRERRHGEFVRVLRMPVEIAADSVDAKLIQGVLTITLPKAEQSRPRRIRVSTTS